MRNTGAGAAVNPRVTLTWPAGIEPAPFSVTGGTGCSWLSSTLTCTSLAPRSQLVLVMPGRLTTDAPYIPLNLIVAASANAPAVGGTGMGTVITDALPPPPPFAVGPTRYYKTIQSAVNAAPPGETISVDGGTYVETVVITKSLTIQRTTVADVPIIDGNKVGSVFFIKSFDARVTLDGLTIRNGTGSYLTGGEHSGGGIFSWGALTVTNCNIIGNTTLYGGEGGGIYSYGELTVRNSTFSGNIGTSGGGIAMRRQGSVRHSTFSGNIATRAGGGLYSTSERPESITIQDSIFSGNQAGAGRPDMTINKLLVVENSIVQAAIDGPNNFVDDPNQPLFVRAPSAGDYGGPAAGGQRTGA